MMRSVEEHLAAVLSLATPLPVETVPVSEARGRVVAASAVAVLDLPSFDNSAMDGYAVRAADVPAAGVRVAVVDDIAAGDTRRLSLPPGGAMRIMTGAPLPEGADAIVPVEASDGGTTTVAFTEVPGVGQHVRWVGEDVRAGDEVVSAGVSVTPGVVALLAAAGIAEVAVHRRPRVAVFSTGDELVPLGTTPGFGQIVDSNQVMLGELVRAAGAELVHSGHLPDDPDLVRAAFADPPGDADLVLTSGGVSMGAHDVVKEVLLAAGTVDFVKVAMRPGMPQGAGHIGGRPIVTLPGNPVSSFVSFHVFVLPLLRRLAGQPAAASLGEEVGAGVVEAAVAWRSVEGKVEFTRVRVAGGAATPMTGQGSHMLGALGAANALAVVPPACAAVEVGQRLSVIRLLGSEVCS